MLWSYPVLSGFMLTLEQCRKVDSTLDDLTDKELEVVRNALYNLGSLAFERWVADMGGSNIPVGDCKE